MTVYTVQTAGMLCLVMSVYTDCWNVMFGHVSVYRLLECYVWSCQCIQTAAGMLCLVMSVYTDCCNVMFGHVSVYRLLLECYVW